MESSTFLFSLFSQLAFPEPENLIISDDLIGLFINHVSCPIITVSIIIKLQFLRAKRSPGVAVSPSELLGSVSSGVAKFSFFQSSAQLSYFSQNLQLWFQRLSYDSVHDSGQHLGSQRLFGKPAFCSNRLLRGIGRRVPYTGIVLLWVWRVEDAE